MTLYIPWLADAARTTGYPVIEVQGWRGRGHGGMRAVELVVGHHTGTSINAIGDYPSLKVVSSGRSDLKGPLCNYGLGRSGTIYVVAAGCAWHAGASAYAGFYDLNDTSIGIEAESAGAGNDWTPEQLDAYPKLVAAILTYIRRGPERYAGHKTVALPSGRKIDPKGITDAWMRERVTAIMNGEVDVPLTKTDTNAVWMQQCTMTYADGRTETHPAAEWLTVMASRIAVMSGQVGGLTAAVSALSNDQDLTVDQVRDIVNEAIRNNIQITGTVEVGTKETK